MPSTWGQAPQPLTAKPSRLTCCRLLRAWVTGGSNTVLVERAYADAHPARVRGNGCALGTHGDLRRSNTQPPHTLDTHSADSPATGSSNTERRQGTGRWAYNPDTSFWALDARGQIGMPGPLGCRSLGITLTEAKQADAECRRYVKFSDD